MHLEGSCHCGRVRFSVESTEPLPFMRCYCSICRKTAGTGGYAINLGADHRTLQVKGRRYVRVYRATLDTDGQAEVSPGQRHFCSHCGTALWMWDPRWPDLVHPHAGAIDTPLPEPPANVHVMLDSKAPWVRVEGRPGDERHAAFPDFSLADWHRAHAPAPAAADRPEGPG
ncbi:GFA family protein [Xenophilus sp. Marseille-Q4582]|uniref:GFA family protein n=1 Tax=Xenophilus sp. Marseille-Q4582 TaxID=2866600 RepID=UPI001CE49D1D|nr:GFA family protein [Xenophilus sp. Marseille-Q4582]